MSGHADVAWERWQQFLNMMDRNSWTFDEEWFDESLDPRYEW
jgi:hypothetical protein